MKRLVLAAVLAASVAPAARAESPLWGSFEFGTGPYRPSIDDSYGGDGPYEAVFGDGRRWGFRAGFAKAVFTGAGSLELGLKSGFFRATGRGYYDDAGQLVRSGDKTAFNVVPSSLTLTWRGDFIPDRTFLPFAPYARVALERYNWWITDGGGKTAGRGATNGWSATAGVAFALDVLDPSLAREMDDDSGVNTTYLYFDVTKAKVDDFGADESWDLSHDGLAWSAGVLLSF